MKLTIGENLRKLRARKNVTQDRLADYLGVTCQAVSRWENRTAYPDIELLPELARFFGVSLEELLGCESGEKEAEDKARIINNEGKYKDRQKALDELHELERQYPNNWYIKTVICSALIEPKPESYDEFLPELRQYGYEVLEAFPPDKEEFLQQVLRALIIAVPEEEVDQWADCLRDVKFMTRPKLMRLRYGEREDWDKSREYESEIILDAVDDLTSLGVTKETFVPSLQAYELFYAMDEAVYKAVIGDIYRDEQGELHNTILMFERVMYACTMANMYFHYVGEDESRIEECFAKMERAADLVIMYADAVKTGYFVSDNPYLVPQKIGAHQHYNFDERKTLGDGSVDYWMRYLQPKWLPEAVRADPRYDAQMERLRRKKAEITEYWRTRESDS